MPTTLDDKLIIAISSSALFDLVESDTIFQEQGIKAYAQYQISQENNILGKGPAFGLVQKLLSLSSNADEECVEVVLLSRNSADTGLRVFNSIQHHGLNITRAAFTSGESPYDYVKAFSAHLFLSTHSQDVSDALAEGHAAARLLPHTHPQFDNGDDILRIAFDGDAVIFSDESEHIFQKGGLSAFTEHEVHHEDNPLNAGPFKGFLDMLHTLQQRFQASDCPIRTALVTARQAPAHKRVIQTLRAWDIRIDEAIFLGGLDKAKFLEAFQADIFFDDQWRHCVSASKRVATGHVASQVTHST